MQPFKIETLANAFMPDATPSVLIGGDAFDVVERFRQKHGGLWVGGKVIATPAGVTFFPNGLNRAFHEELGTIHIPLASISSVKREFGWVTGIVVIEHTQGVFRFRCFGAKNIAAMLASHITPP